MGQPTCGIAAIVTDGTLRAFCAVCPWWSGDVGRTYDTNDYRRSAYARARAELTRHILTPRHAARRARDSR